MASPLTLGFSAGYLNAKYKNFVYGGPGTDYVFTDLSGTRMTNSPEIQLSFTAHVDQPINDHLRLVATGLVTHSSSILFAQSGSPGFLPPGVDPGYWLANLRVGIRTSDDKYGIAVFANNAFNSRYTTYASSSPLTGTSRTWGNPRIIGVEVTAKF